jgi:hypothetical protein
MMAKRGKGLNCFARMREYEEIGEYDDGSTPGIGLEVTPE